MRALPRWVRRSMVAGVLVVAIPVSFFNSLAREWWFGLRMAARDAREQVAVSRRMWRG